MSITCLSLAFLRAAVALAFRAVWRATPCSQLTTLSLGTIDAALRTRTRKVAWKASSASWWLWRTRRHTPQTIGPCRCTRAARAASSRRLRKLSSSCPSVSPAPSRGSSTLQMCRMTSRIWLVALSFPLWATPPLYSYYNRHRGLLIRFFRLRPARGRPDSGFLALLGEKASPGSVPDRVDGCVVAEAAGPQRRRRR